MASKFKIQNEKFKILDKDVWQALWWVVLPGVVGARIYHVADLWDYYREHLVLIPALWMGGMGIFGAIAGGVVGLWIYCRWKCMRELRSLNGNLLGRRWLRMILICFLRILPGRWPGLSDQRKFVELPALQSKARTAFSACFRQHFLAFLDLTAFGLPVGQAVGRWGNYFNQELYGKPTDLPWGVFISLGQRVRGVEQYTHFHPLFLYESIYLFLIFTVLWFFWRRKGTRLHAGSYFFVYLILYGLGRFWLEGLRIASWMVVEVNVAQAISGLIIVLGGVLLYSFNRK